MGPRLKKKKKGIQIFSSVAAYMVALKKRKEKNNRAKIDTQMVHDDSCQHIFSLIHSFIHTLPHFHRRLALT